MRIAYVCIISNQTNVQIKELFLRVPDVEFFEYYLDNGMLFTHEGKYIPAYDVTTISDVYILDSSIPTQVQENLHYYFDMHGMVHLFGKTYIKNNSVHGLLLAKSDNVCDTNDDIERKIVSLWTSMPHPICVKKEETISEEISSIHELRRHIIPYVFQGKYVECIYQPKGRKLACTFLRNARGKKIYVTPLFEKITYHGSDKLFSASLLHEDKEKIIKKLENLFSHYPSFPVLHIELTHTPHGLYLMHATPLYNLTNEVIPGTLRAIGMQPFEILTSCISSLPTK